MPKLAKYYEERNYYNSRAPYGGYTQERGIVVDFHTNPHPNQNVKSKRLKRKKSVKKNFVQSFINCLLSLILMFFVLPFGFNKITKSIFIPTPYKNIKTDLRQISFPTHNYLSNAWFMGERSFRLAATEKNAQMIPLNENVNMPVLQSQLTNLMAAYPNIQPTVFVWDYETNNYVDINADKIYSAASIIKIPVLIDVFKSIEAGQFSLSDKIPLTEYFRTEGSGSLQFRAANSTYTIDELANRMITESDNSSTNMLMAKVGSMTDVNQAIRDWGLKHTEVHTWLPDYAGTNYTTARDLATMLYNIDENDKLLTEFSRSKILNYMGHVHNNRLIHAGLGEGSVFLHKTGDIGKMLGDAGIVITPNSKKYIVVIMANRPHNDFAGKEFIVKASEIIYNYMVK